jgi:hypothetical protein
MPVDREAREGLKQAQGLTTLQLQTLAGYLEDAEGFQRTFLYSSYRQYLHPRLRLYGGYGYLNYGSSAAFFPSIWEGFSEIPLYFLILRYCPIGKTSPHIFCHRAFSIASQLGCTPSDGGSPPHNVAARHPNHLI